MFNRIKFCCKKDIWNDRGAIYNLTHMDGATKISELLNLFFCSESSSFPVFLSIKRKKKGLAIKQTNTWPYPYWLIDWLIVWFNVEDFIEIMLSFFISHKWWSHQQMVNLQLIQAKCCAAPQWEPIHRRQKKWKAFGHCSVACLHGMEGGIHENTNMYHLSIAALTACKLAWHGGGIQTNEHPAYPAVSRHRLIQNTQKQKYNHTNTNTKVQIHKHKYKQIQKYPACPAVSHPRL